MVWLAYSCFFWLGILGIKLGDIPTLVERYRQEKYKKKREKGEGKKTHPPASPVGRENPLPVEPSLELIARTKEMVAPRRWVRRAVEEVRMMVLRSIITVFWRLVPSVLLCPLLYLGGGNGWVRWSSFRDAGYSLLWLQPNRIFYRDM